MINEFLEIFKKVYEEHGDQYVIDEYIPKDGTYILVDYNTWKIKNRVEIKYDKKKKEIIGENNKDFSFIAACDYYSSLLAMNKPIGPKKIHSNQMYSFFIKKEGLYKELTQEMIDEYKSKLLNPKSKYKKESLQRYEFIEKELPKINIELGEKIFEWIQKNIYRNEEYKNTKESDYLKIFFIEENEERSLKNFKEEYKRYIFPNIFNSNSYNIEIDNTIYGASSNNMSLNSKKPYLESKTRKVKTPYLISYNEAILHKAFYDYLLTLAKKDKNFVYCTSKKIEGKTQGEVPPNLANYLFKISYGKDVIKIYSFDIISSPKREKFSFYFEEILSIGDVSTKGIQYGVLDWEETLNSCNALFFNGILLKNLENFDDELEVQDSQLKKIMRKYRDSFYRWLYLGDETQVRKKSKDLLLDSILFSVKNGYGVKMKHQINLWLSLENYLNEGGNIVEKFKEAGEMFLEHVRTKENWKLESDEEYAYAIGQVLSFFNFKRNTKNKDATLLKEVLFVSNNSILKDRVSRICERNLHNINTTNRKLSKTIANIMRYQPVQEIIEVRKGAHYIMAGFLDTIAFFDKEGKENETNE